MASLLLTVAGSVVGNALLPGIGGPLLASIGALAGSEIDRALFGAPVFRGPRLENLKVQDSSYGNGIPVLYGRCRVSGNVIWASDLIETIHSDETGGKGGGGGATVERVTYAVNCAVAVGEGPIGGIATIWADGKVIYENGRWKSGTLNGSEIYKGGQAQTASPIMEAALGAGKVPAYRGIAYVAMERLQLSNFGNRLPNLTFEVLPATALANPVWNGEADPVLTVPPDSLQCANALPPIPVARQGSRITQVLCGGITITGDEFRFTAVEYNIGGAGAPVEMSRTTSGLIGGVPGYDSIKDLSWAVSPDKRYIAFYLYDSFSAGNHVVITLFDIANRSFGAVIDEDFGAAPVFYQVSWIDAQRFILADIVSGAWGVRIYAASGNTPVPLGFRQVWEAGSGSTRFVLPFAQFAPKQSGLLFIIGNHFTAPTTLYAAALGWQEGSLQVGTALTLSSSIASFTSQRAVLLPMPSGEIVLARSSFTEIRLMSFVASPTNVSVTRNWTTISASPTGTVSVNRRDDVICFVKQSFTNTNYRYGEITPETGTFSLSLPSQTVNGIYSGLIDFFSPYPVGPTRILLQGADAGSGFQRVALFERGARGASLTAITEDILTRAGYAAEDYDLTALADATVDGYALPEPMPARAALEPLQGYQPFDLIESDGILKARLYSADVDTALSTSELRAVIGEREPPPAFTRTRRQELDLPREVDVDYIDPALDYQRGSQRARRLATSATAKEQLRLALVCSAQKAKRVAESHLYRLWAEREDVEASSSRRLIALDPGDVVSNGAEILRLTSVTQDSGIVKLAAVPVSGNALSSAADAEGGSGVVRRDGALVPSVLYVMDVPLLRRADNQPGYYAAVTGISGWRGAALLRSADGMNFSTGDRFSLPATAGTATSVLADVRSEYMDRANSVTVALLHGSLSSCTGADLLNGANAALLGDEIIQFQTATLNSDGSTTLSHLLRGRRSTESTTSAHLVGERFVLLQEETAHFLPLLASTRGTAIYLRAVSAGQDEDDAANRLFTPQLATLRPFAPVHVGAARNNNGDAAISWKRRARIDAEWLDWVDVPLDETSESYDVEILDGGNVVRSFAGVSAASQNYTAAQQIEDFGATQAEISVRIYQNGSLYGRGSPASAVV